MKLISLVFSFRNEEENLKTLVDRVHKAVERPVVVGGKITIRRMMNLSSSWDHRVVDGADGAALVQGLKYLLEHPTQIL